MADAEEPLTHPEEIRAQAEVLIGGRRVARASARITPAGLICGGLAAAAILLSATALLRAVAGLRSATPPPLAGAARRQRN